MPNVRDRTVMKRFTRAVAKRNQNFLSALQLIDTQGCASANAIQQHLNFSSISTARVLIRELTRRELIELSYVGDKAAGHCGTPYYKLLPDAQEKGFSMFPTEESQVTVVGTKNGSSNRPSIHVIADDDEVPTTKAVRRTVVKVQRDPMHVLLMGTGKAPSLRFRGAAHA